MLADPSKFRNFGMSRLVLWSKVNILVTIDAPENRPLLETIQKQGVTVVYV